MDWSILYYVNQSWEKLGYCRSLVCINESTRVVERLHFILHFIHFFPLYLNSNRDGVTFRFQSWLVLEENRRKEGNIQVVERESRGENGGEKNRKGNQKWMKRKYGLALRYRMWVWKVRKEEKKKDRQKDWSRKREREWQKKGRDGKVVVTALRLLLTIPHLYIW